MKKRILTLLKVLFFLSIGFFFIWIFLRQLTPDQRQDIIVSLKNADYSWIILSIFFGIISHLLRAARWRLLINPMGYQPALSNTFFAVMLGYFANLALPRLGEVTRCGMLGRYEKIPVNKILGTVIAERSVDMLIFLGLFFINLLIFWRQLYNYVQNKIFTPVEERVEALGSNTTQLLIIASAAAALVIGMFILRRFFGEAKFYLKIKSIVKGFVEGIKSVLMVKNVWFFIMYSLLIWVMYFLMVYVCFFSIPETSGLGLVPALSVLIFGSIGIMIVQGGIGVYPAIVAEVLAIYGVMSVEGYALGWLAWTAQNVMIVIFGMLSLILMPVLTKNTNYGQSEHTEKEDHRPETSPDSK